MRERRLAETGRTEEKHVIQRLASAASRGDEYAQLLANRFLPDVIGKLSRAQPIDLDG
jgi:hypothetical protein